MNVIASYEFEYFHDLMKGKQKLDVKAATGSLNFWSPKIVTTFLWNTEMGGNSKVRC